MTTSHIYVKEANKFVIYVVICGNIILQVYAIYGRRSGVLL